MIYTSQPPSMAYGYASPASQWWPYAKYPELHRGRVAGYCPSLGNTADRLWDFEGNGNNGTMMPTFATGPTWAVSEGRYANSFDGSNDYIALDKQIPNQTDGTYSAWIYSPSTTGNRTVFGSTGTGTSYVLLWFRVGADWYIFIGNASPVTQINWIIPGSQPDWLHMLATKTGNTYELWVNGNSQGTKTMTGISPVDFIGRGQSGASNYYWKDNLDDIQIFNRALSQNEITQLYQLGRGGSYAIDYEMMMEEIAAGGPFPHFIRRSQQLSGGLVAC